MSSPESSLTLRVRGGARLCVPASLDQITTYVLLEQDDWFEEEIRFVRARLRPGMQAVDLGANLGTYTLAMARAVAPGRVWAFEPAPATAELLERSLALNGCANAELHRVAVTDRDGSAGFAVGAASELNAIAAADGADGAVIRVPCATLDSLAARHGWRDVDFLKMDLEGQERAAVLGGAAFLAAASPLLMFEISKEGELDLGAVEPLAALGYALYRLVPGLLALAPLSPLEEPVDAFQLNCFACKADRARTLEAQGALVPDAAREAGAPAAGAWAAFARAAPYARRLAAAWPRQPGFFAAAHAKAYFEALDAYAASRDAARPAGERLALLDRALGAVAEAIQGRDGAGRRLSQARIAWELGWRVLAVDALEAALAQIAAARAPGIEEPFLAPSPRHEAIEAGGDPLEWMRCAAAEQYERLRAFTSLYNNLATVELLAPLERSPYRSVELDRRLFLVRRRHGLPNRPVAETLLAREGEDNLNAGFWGRLQ
jgi:FkbM family methyltransferase